MPGELQPLVNNQKIANPDGTPTDYFIRWAQQRQIDITGGVPASREINTGTGLTGGGDLSEDRTLSLDADLGDLNDVDVIPPPTDGQVLKYVAADGKWKPGSGGGGGGAASGRYWRLRAERGGNASNPTDGLGYTLVNYRDAGGIALIPTPGLGGFANATDTGGGWAVAEAFNGASGAGNGWYSGSGGAGGVYHSPYLGYDFGASVTPASVEFAPLFGFVWTIGEIVSVDYSDDREIWKTLCLIDPRPGANNVVQSYTLPT